MSNMVVKAASLLLLLALTATTCGPDPLEGTDCYRFEGIEDIRPSGTICSAITTESSIVLGIEPEDAEDFVIRIHPDDAQRYFLPEEAALELDPRTGGSIAIVRRFMEGPATVCLRYPIYLVDLVEQRQLELLPGNGCTSFSASWSPSVDEANDPWEPLEDPA